MSEYVRGGLRLDDEDRLPWLEPAIDEDAGRGVSPLRLLGLVLLGLLLVGAVIAGVWLAQKRSGGATGGEGELIAAPGPYKLPANEADARKFDGEGDASFAASEGVMRDGRIDPSRVPEAPITKTTPPPGAASSGPATPAQSVTARVTDGTDARGAASSTTPPGGTMVQLGAYGSEAVAKDGWKKLSQRYPYLAPLAMTIEPAQVGGGTVYRLRAAAGAQARTICGRLKVAGESCLVVG